jgi:hypothetical protein
MVGNIIKQIGHLKKILYRETRPLPVRRDLPCRIVKCFSSIWGYELMSAHELYSRKRKLVQG